MRVISFHLVLFQDSGLKLYLEMYVYETERIQKNPNQIQVKKKSSELCFDRSFIKTSFLEGKNLSELVTSMDYFNENI